MQRTFDKTFWEENLRYPDWYVRLSKELIEVFAPITADEELRQYRHTIYEFVGDMLRTSQIPLAENGPNFDKERKPIDILVIHHTKENPNIRQDTLSAIGLIRQYALDYLTNDVLGYSVYGKPLWSGHFQKSKQVFFAYHWLVRPNGSIERLLQDEYIGWHAGNWDTNTRSIAIALSGNYEHAIPPTTQLEATQDLIRRYYSQVESKRIIGHHEVSEETTCPGEKFLSVWKNQLLP